MGRIYAYAPTEQDCTTIGMVGALLPTECTFNLKAGEFGELTMVHPCDPYGKWKALEQDAILKAPVPVRICPAFDENSEYITTVYHYNVKLTASKDARTLYKGGAADNKKKVVTLAAGQELVSMSEYNALSDRYKVTAKVGKKSYTGWISIDALDETTEEPETIVPGPQGFEAAQASYAVKDQLFRITQVTKRSENGFDEIEVTAMRLVYDLSGVPTDYIEKTEITGKAAARKVLSEAYRQGTGYTIYSDIGTVHLGCNMRSKNVIEALCDPDAGIAGIFNAQPVCDDYDIYMLAQAGMDRGVVIRYAKNMLGVTCETDSSEAVEGILPHGEAADGDILRIKADTNIGAGYERRDRGDGTVSPYIIYKTGVTTPTHRVATVEVSDAKVDKKSDVTEANAIARLVQEAHSYFENGCYAAKVSLDVDFLLLGDTDEYRQYKHLDSLFVYDTVSIHHPKLGINTRITLTELTWDCLAERVTEAHFGELKDLTPTVSSMQISKVDGGKIGAGTIGAKAIGEGIIKANHIQAESINAEAMQTETFTADTAYVRHMDALAIDAVSANIRELSSELVDTHELQADTLTSALAAFDILKAASAELNEAKVKALFTEVGIVDKQTITDLYAQYLRVDYLTASNATIGRCVLLGDDGNYYKLHIGADGTVTTEQTQVTQQEEAAGTTGDGLTVIKDVGVFDDLSSGVFSAIHGRINQLTSELIRVDTLFARQAFISALKTTQITADGGTLQIIADHTEDSYKKLAMYFTFDDNGLTVRKKYADGTTSVWSSTMDNGGYKVRNRDVFGIDGRGTVFQANAFGAVANGYECGELRVRKSANGWIWTDKEVRT